MLDPDSGQRPTADVAAARLDAIASPATKPLVKWATIGAAVAASVAGIVLWTLSDPDPISPATSPWTNYQGSETEPAFSPDGTRIAFAWTGEAGIDRDVYVKPVGGTSDPIRITPGDANYFAPAWSPDGRQIAMLRGVRGFSQDVLVVPASGGEPRLVGRIADPQGYSRPVAWWPDGQALLVRDTQGGIRYVRWFLSGAPPQVMTSPPPGEQDTLATPSPDGSQIAFARVSSGKAAICLLRSDGTPQDGAIDPCIHRTSSVTGLAWQADGRALFVADPSALWRLGLSNRRVTRVRKIANGNYGGLAGDPRHPRFAFTQTYSDMNLWRMDRDGGNARKIASSSAEDSEAQFSPDGQRFVFRSRRSGAYELWVANADGSQVKQITTTGGHLGSAQWSPDGTHIAFDGNRFTVSPFKDSRHTNIYVVSASGGPVRPLTDDRMSAMVPSWSRDGQWIYYSSSGDGRVDLWKVAATGGQPVRISEGPIFEVIESADTRYLYFTRLFKEAGIWRRPINGGSPTLLSGTEGVRDRHWEYHTDGVYFVDGTSTLMLRFYRFDTGEVTPVVAFPPRVAIGPRAVTVSPDGRTVIYCQEDLTLSDIALMEMPDG
jgi:eukaryotic-like serine/threonine-protein kinase